MKKLLLILLLLFPVHGAWAETKLYCNINQLGLFNLSCDMKIAKCYYESGKGFYDSTVSDEFIYVNMTSTTIVRPFDLLENVNHIDLDISRVTGRMIIEITDDNYKTKRGPGASCLKYPLQKF